MPFSSVSCDVTRMKWLIICAGNENPLPVPFARILDCIQQSHIAFYFTLLSSSVFSIVQRSHCTPWLVSSSTHLISSSVSSGDTWLIGIFQKYFEVLRLLHYSFTNHPWILSECIELVLFY